MKRETSDVPLLPIFSKTLLALAFLACAGVFVGQLHSEEPYQRFLQRLRDEQLYDLALVYLSDLEKQPAVSPEFKADIQVERGLLLYQSAAMLPKSHAERALKLDRAEAALRDFLATKTNHPRRGEARLKLGELLLTRADEAKSEVQGVPSQDIPQAIKFYTDAHELFEGAIQELAAVLEQLKGARVDAADTAQVAFRQKVQQDLRQAQLLSAKAVDDRGRSRAADSPERTADLQQALQMFSDLYSKEQRMVGVRNYALYYRSLIQTELGKNDDAIDGFQRIADLEGVDVLRPLQANSIRELIQLLAAQDKYPVAVDRAEKWLADIRPDERNTVETLELQLKLAELKLAWATQLQAKSADDRVALKLQRDARTELRGLLRTPGPHLDTTRQLLVSAGVEETNKPSAELPQVKNFGEALAAAQERIDRAETETIGLESLKLELANADTPADKKQQLTQQIQQTQEAIDVDQQQALELLRTALAMYQSSDDRGQLFDARFRIAFLSLKQQRPWDAVVIGQFLARTNAGSDQGLRAATITLAGFSDLLRAAGAEDKARLTDQLKPFAEYLLATWPQSPEAAAAASALVQLALINQQFEQAEQFLDLVPDTGDASQGLRRDVGVAFYAQYLEEKKTAGGENDATQQLRSKAIKQLQLGTQGLTADKLDAAIIEAINGLVRLLLSDNQLDAAAKIMLDSEASPLKKLEKEPQSVASRTAMETYRTAIQLINGRLAEDKIPADQAVAQMRDYIQRLQQAAGNDADGKQVLSGIFVALARDLKDQLTAASDDAKRKKMSEALVIVAAEAAKSDSFNTQYWAADTIISMADELSTSAAGKTQAQAAYAAAAKVLQAILAKEKQQPGWIDPPAFSTQVRLKLAQTQRGLGDYKTAIEELATILESNNNLLDVQMEAARTYQAWGSAVNAGFHKVAIVGGRPDPKTRQKLFWGWGKIQQMTANQPNFSEQFYEARYQLAYSRLQYAGSLNDPTLKKEEIERAEKDILATAQLYPNLGGAGMQKKFDGLLRSIQKSLGKPTVGLAVASK